MFASLVQITWWDHCSTYKSLVLASSSLDEITSIFKSYGKWYIYFSGFSRWRPINDSSLYAKFSWWRSFKVSSIFINDYLIKIVPSGELWSTINQLRVSMYRKRTPFDPSEVYDEAAAREWNWNYEFSDWSSNLISSNLIRRSNWLLNYFWKLFLNQNFSFLHIQIKFIVREFYCSMSRSKVTWSQVVTSSRWEEKGHQRSF